MHRQSLGPLPHLHGATVTPLQPRLTIQNLEVASWLVTIEHTFSAEQSLVFTTQVPKHLREAADLADGKR